MKVIVTGATGFVASHLLPALTASGHEVTAVGHDLARIPSVTGVNPVLLDLARPFGPDDLPAADAVVHLAQANVRFPEGADALFAVNASATQQLLEHARVVGASTFVLASSGSVYGPSEEVLHEGSPLRATDFYSATKVAAERLVGAYAGEFSSWTLRLFVPYGPGQTGRMVPAIASRVRARQPVQLNDGGRPRTNPVYVDDLVAVIMRALLADGNHTLNVAGDDVVDIRQLAEAMGSILDVEPLLQVGDQSVAGDIVADTTRLHSLFPDVAWTSLEDGLRRMLGRVEG